MFLSGRCLFLLLNNLEIENSEGPVALGARASSAAEHRGDSRTTPGGLFVVQRLHRVQSSGAARRHVAGEQSNAGEDRGHDQERSGIPWRDAEE